MCGLRSGEYKTPDVPELKFSKTIIDSVIVRRVKTVEFGRETVCFVCVLGNLSSLFGKEVRNNVNVIGNLIVFTERIRFPYKSFLINPSIVKSRFSRKSRLGQVTSDP